MDRDIFKLVKKCNIVEGKLELNSISTETVRDINISLREALLDGDIPHYRVVGIHARFKGNNSNVDFITELNGIGMSYVGLMKFFSNLIFAETSGIGTIHFPEYVGSFGFLEVSDSIFYQGMGVNSVPKSLVVGSEDVRGIGSNSDISIIVAKGTKMFDFPYLQNILKKSEYKPLRAVFDLNSIFSINLYQEGDTCIRFHYKTEINESVLTDLIHGYAESLI